MATPSIWRRLPGIIMAVAVFLLAAGNIPYSFYPYGSAIWARMIVSLVGMTGAVCLLAGIGWWHILLAVWCGVQSINFATDTSGEWFYQGLMLGFSYKTEQSSSNNHLMMSYSASGFATTGVVLLAGLLVVMTARLHPPVKRQFPGWKIGLAAVFAVVVVWAGVGIWWHEQADDAAFVIKVKGLRVPIYYQGMLLGYSPLAVTPERVAEWKLPLKPESLKYMTGSGWADCVLLGDAQKEIPLFAGAPLLGGDKLDTFETPWGTRYRFHIDGESGNVRSGFYWPVAELRGDPVVTISLKPGVPVVAGRPFVVHCVLSNPTSTSYEGGRSELTRFCRSFGPSVRNWTPPTVPVETTVELPESWNKVSSGARFEGDFEFDAPRTPGEYEFFCPWFLFDKKVDSSRGSGSAYSNVLLLRVVPDRAPEAATSQPAGS